jgi:hypothetical protein
MEDDDPADAAATFWAGMLAWVAAVGWAERECCMGFFNQVETDSEIKFQGSEVRRFSILRRQLRRRNPECNAAEGSGVRSVSPVSRSGEVEPSAQIHP